jgi:hypothetical protein
MENGKGDGVGPLIYLFSRFGFHREPRNRASKVTKPKRLFLENFSKSARVGRELAVWVFRVRVGQC